MKKQIEITEKATKTIEVEVPSFLNEHGVRVAITDHCVIKVWPDSILIAFTPASNKERYSKEIGDMFQYKTKPPSITKQEFEISFNNTIKCLTEQYQLSMNMQDPNLQQAEGQQATEEKAALESATQDNAMEATQDSEEGSTEG